MTIGCAHRDLALERRLDPSQQAAFAAHVHRCTACRRAVAAWDAARAALDAFVEERCPPPTPERATRLIAAAQRPSSCKPHRAKTRWAAAVLGAAAAAAVLVLIAVWTPAQTPAHKLQTKTIAVRFLMAHRRVEHRAVRRGALLGGRGKQVASVRHTRIGVAPGAQVALLGSSDRENRLRIQRGTVAFSLPKSGVREALTVGVGRYAVRVTGTIFWVHRLAQGPITVGVVRGAVEVEDNETQTTWSVPAGRKLVLPSAVRGARVNPVAQPTTTSEQIAIQDLLDPDATEPVALRPPKTGGDGDAHPERIQRSARHGQPHTGQSAPTSPVSPAMHVTDIHDRRAPDRRPQNPSRKAGSDAPRADRTAPHPSLDTIGDMVLHGRYQAAHRALRARLDTLPDDRATRELLATCLRKQGRYEETAAVYEALTTKGTVRERNRARYKLAALLQDRLANHRRAMAVLIRYLDTPATTRPNTPEARLRLAYAQRALGRYAHYRRTLEQVVALHPGTQAAATAAALLERATP